MEEKYLVELTAQEVKGLGERRWMRQHSRWMWGMGLSVVLIAIGGALGDVNKPISISFIVIGGLLFVATYVRWIQLSGKEGVRFYQTTSGLKETK
jgi:hypothetical protein